MLIGRDAERERVAELLDAARNGTSGVLLIHGEAGAGKTALLRDATARATDMTVLAVRGVQTEVEIGFGALYDLLRPVLDRIDRLLPAQAGALRGALGMGPPVEQPLTVALGTLSLLAAVAEDGPVLVTIDDAHW